MAQIDIERGDRAQEVLDNEVYRDAFVAIEQGLIDAWKRSANPADRERLWTERMLLSKVQTYLESTMQSGKLARLKPTTMDRAMSLVRTGLR